MTEPRKRVRSALTHTPRPDPMESLAAPPLAPVEDPAPPADVVIEQEHPQVTPPAAAPLAPRTVGERELKPRRSAPTVPCYTALDVDLDARLSAYATSTGATKRSIIEAALDAYLPS